MLEIIPEVMLNRSLIGTRNRKVVPNQGHEPSKSYLPIAHLVLELVDGLEEQLFPWHDPLTSRGERPYALKIRRGHLIYLSLAQKCESEDLVDDSQARVRPTKIVFALATTIGLHSPR